MSGVEMLLTAAAVAASYASGSIPFGWLLGKWVTGKDIRQYGSRNIGATNLARVAGRGWGVLAFLLDVAKGLGPVLVFPWAVGRLIEQPWLYPEHLGVACAAGAIVGHVFPFTLGFRGGKAVATSLGATLGLVPVPSLLAFGVWVIVVAVSRYVSLGSIVATISFPLWHIALGSGVWSARGLPVTVAAILLAVLIVVRHRGNIARLAAGTESKIGRQRETPDGA